MYQERLSAPLIPHEPSPPRMSVPELPPHDYVRPDHYTVAIIDGHGRVATTAPLRALGWGPGRVIAFTVDGNRLITATPIDPARPGSTSPRRGITPRGHLNLPIVTRRRAGLTGGDRLLLAADPNTGVLRIFPPHTLALILRPYTGNPGRQS